MEKINYVLATWSGNRRIPNKKYLKDHILKLLSLKNNLSQITIVKPLFYGYDDSYYDFNEILTEFKTKIVILERNSNLGQSYGQLLYTYETYLNEFDYYIFIEDDYLPNIDNFDSLLLNEYKEKQVNGYLCSYAGINPEYPNGGCSVSNGMIATKFLKQIYDKNKSPINKIDSHDGNYCHKNFADLIIESELEFKDFADKYRVPYFGTYIIEYGRTDTTNSIFVPHQLFNIDFEFKLMSISDLPEFLEIRNEAKDFLHNNTVFNLNDAIKWFNNAKPIFYMITLNGKNIGYFRTSNLKDKSIYIGCDIHKIYRGYGLGYIVYKKFIPKIYDMFEVETIKLEVLSTNDRAINLYKKLGFIEICKSNKIIRDNQEIDSIVMELK